MIELYNKIKNTREDLDIKQYEFAKDLDIKLTTYSKYENGFLNIPIDVLDKISIKLNVSVDYLLDITKQRNYGKVRKMNYHIFLTNIRNYRKLNKYTLTTLAEKLYITPQALHNYELGLREVPVSILRELSIIFDVSADILLGKLKKIKK